MVFQFLCPQGHLLQGDESHGGMPTRCPHCGVTFIIPRVDPQPESFAAHVPDEQPAWEQPRQFAHQPEVEEPAHEQPVAEMMNDLLGDEPDMMLPATAAERIVHIPCPNGHELETPFDMIGQEVLCPHCGVQFRLRNEDSLEYQAMQARVDERRAKLWLNCAIAVGVVVGLVLLGFIIVSLTS